MTDKFEISMMWKEESKFRRLGQCDLRLVKDWLLFIMINCNDSDHGKGSSMIFRNSRKLDSRNKTDFICSDCNTVRFQCLLTWKFQVSKIIVK